MRTLPTTLYPPHGEFDTAHAMLDFLDNLWFECAQEWNDPRFLTRTHGNHKTYQAGCKGPICAMGMREVSRQRTNAEPRKPFVWLDPIINEYLEIMKEQEEIALKQVRERMASESLTHQRPEIPA
jgi:hypothetical protein